MRGFLTLVAFITLAAWYGSTHEKSPTVEPARAENAGSPVSECHMMMSPRQAYQIHEAIEQMKQSNPNGRHLDKEDLQAINVVNQLMCSGASYEEAAKEALGFIRATSKLLSQ